MVLSPRSVDECMVLAAELSKATTIAGELQGKPANVLAAIMAGHELGFAPMASLRSVHIIKGVPKLSADAMVAAVLASGKALYFEPSAVSHSSVTYVTKRVGSQREQSCTWTAEDAKRAGLVSDNHRLYSRQMLSARAMSELARRIYPDVLAGVYTDEEISSGRTDSDPPPAGNYEPDITDAEIVTAPEGLADALAGIESAESIDALKSLAKSIQALKLTGSFKEDASAKYAARMAFLKNATKPVEAVA
jgi:hypothetical protein